MKKILILIVFLMIAAPAGRILAASPTAAKDGVTYRTSIRQDNGPPICGPDQVLTYDGQRYSCTDNYRPVNCAPNVIRNLNEDGYADCSPFQYPEIKCDPGEILHHFRAKSGGMIVQCLKITSPPDCDNNQVLTNTPSGLKCINPTLSKNVGIGALTAINGYCKAATIMGSNGNKNVFSAMCIAACNKWCKANTTFSAGTLTGYYAGTAVCACTR